MSTTNREQQLKKLIVRSERLVEHIKEVQKNLSLAGDAERHAAVLVCGRIINVLMSNFEFDASLESRKDTELNSSLVRVVSTDMKSIRDLMMIEDEILNSMINHLTNKIYKTRSELSAIND